MATYLTIHVTQEDIDAGVPQSSGNCPVALAMVGICDCPHVRSDGSMEFIYAGSITTYRSLRVHQFTKAFDQRQPVEPFSFRIRVP